MPQAASSTIPPLPPGTPPGAVIETYGGGATTPPLPPGTPPGAVIETYGAPQPPGFMDRLGQAYEDESAANIQTGELAGRATKDVALGAAENVTGLGELVPGLHPYAAAGSRYLHSKVDSPTLEDVGYLGGAMAGGGVLGASRLAGLVPEAAEGAGTLAKALTGAERGAIAGSTGGAALGLTDPTGIEDYGKSLKQKAAVGALSWATGGIGGGVLGATGPLVEGGKALWDAAHKKEAEALAQALRQKVAGATKDTVDNTELAQRMAGDESEELQGKQERLDTRLEQMDRAESRLSRPLGSPGGENPREKVPDVIGPKTPEQAAEHLAAKLAGKQRINAQELGDYVDQLSDSIYNRLYEERATKSGLSEVLKNASEAPDVDTSAIDAYIDSEAKNAAGGTRSVLNWIKHEIHTEAPVENGAAGGMDPVEIQMRKALGAPLPADEGVGVESKAAINLAKTESLRKAIASALRTKTVSFETNTMGVDAETAHHLNNIRTMLMDSAGKVSEEYPAALKRFADMSRPMDIFERKGVLRGTQKEDFLSGDREMESADIITRLMNRTAKGNTALEQLMEQPEAEKLKGQMDRYFQYKFFGEKRLGEPADPERLRKLLVANKEALEQTGLFNKYNKLVANVEQALDRLRGAAATTKAASAETKAAVGRTQAELESARNAEHEYRGILAQLEDPAIVPDKKLAGEAISTAKKLYKEKYITQEDMAGMIEDARKVEQGFVNAAEARQKLHRIFYLAAGLVGGGAVAHAGYRMLQ